MKSSGNYQFRKGSRLPQDRAQATGEELTRLGPRALVAREVVDESRDASAPLHWAFEWDNDTAADEYRLDQARHLIRSVEVVTVDDRGYSTSRPLFVHVRVEQEDTEGALSPAIVGYRNTMDAMADPEMRSRILAQALRDIESLRRKYSQLSELAEVFYAAERVGRLAAKAA